MTKITVRESLEEHIQDIPEGILTDNEIVKAISRLIHAALTIGGQEERAAVVWFMLNLRDNDYSFSLVPKEVFSYTVINFSLEDEPQILSEENLFEDQELAHTEVSIIKGGILGEGVMMVSHEINPLGPESEGLEIKYLPAKEY